MVKYVKCPRCELNYIDSEKQEYCDVCLAELTGGKLKFADLDDLVDEDIIEEEEELCPICGVNYMKAGEKMCDECKISHADEYDEDPTLKTEDEDEEWKSYLDEDEVVELADDDLALDEDELKALDEAEETDTDEKEESAEDDEFEDIGDIDDVDAFDDDDEEEDDDEEKEDDDF